MKPKIRILLDPAPPADGGPPPITDSAAPRSGDYPEAFSAIDSIDGVDLDGQPSRTQPDPVPAKPAAPAAPAAPSTPSAPAPTTPDAKTEGDEPDFGLSSLVAKPPAATPDAKLPESGNLAQFRQEYETLKTKAKDQETELSKFRMEIAERDRMKEELETNRKRMKELESDIRYSNYRKSPEYKEKFQTPIMEAWEDVTSILEGVMIQDPDSGQDRPVTAQDLVPLLRMPPLRAAASLRERFGEHAAIALGPRLDNIRQLGGHAARAEREWKEKGDQLSAERESEAKAERETLVKTYQTEVQDWEQRHPDLFGPVPTDPELHQEFQKGDTLAKRALLFEGIPDGLTPQQRQQLILRSQAQLALRSRTFGIHVLRGRRLQAEVSALKAKLATYERSDPPIGGETSQPRQGGMEMAPAGYSPEDAIDNLVGVG